MSKGKNATPEIHAAVKERLLPAVSDLKDIQERLKALQESLPAASARVEEEMDAVTELRSVLGCVLLDSIGPAIRDLLAAADFVAKGGTPGGR
jgi:hypothetical protein